jgi:cytosolic carboxypeptidase protein 2/3
MSFDYTFEYD